MERENTAHLRIKTPFSRVTSRLVCTNVIFQGRESKWYTANEGGVAAASFVWRMLMRAAYASFPFIPIKMASFIFGNLIGCHFCN